MKKFLLVMLTAVLVMAALSACSEHKSELQKAQEAAMETYQAEETMDPAEAKLNAPKGEEKPIAAIYMPGENGKLDMDFVNVDELDGVALVDELVFAGVLPQGLILSLDEGDEDVELGFEGIDSLTDEQIECVTETFVQNLGLKKFKFLVNEEVVVDYEKTSEEKEVGPGFQ